MEPMEGKLSEAVLHAFTDENTLKMFGGIFQDVVSLLDKGSRLTDKAKRDFGLDLSKHQDQMEVLVERLNSIKKKENPGDAASLRKREAYNTGMRKIVEEFAVEVENWVRAIYKDAIEGENDRASLSNVVFKCVMGAVLVTTCIGGVIGAVVTGKVFGLYLAVGTLVFGMPTVASGWKSKEKYEAFSKFKSQMELLRADAEKYRKEIQKIKTSLQLASVDLRVEEAP